MFVPLCELCRLALMSPPDCLPHQVLGDPFVVPLMMTSER
jgi:hypothetical protein